MTTTYMRINGTQQQVDINTDCTGKTEYRLSGRLIGWTQGTFTYGKDSRVISHCGTPLPIFAQTGL